MKKDEIIELLKEQIASLRADNDRLLLQVEALTQEIASLNEALLQKGESLSSCLLYTSPSPRDTR